MTVQFSIIGHLPNEFKFRRITGLARGVPVRSKVSRTDRQKKAVVSERSHGGFLGGDEFGDALLREVEDGIKLGAGVR